MFIIFSVLPFTLAQKLQLPILPVCLHTSRAFQIRTVGMIFFLSIEFLFCIIRVHSIVIRLRISSGFYLVLILNIISSKTIEIVNRKMLFSCFFFCSFLPIVSSTDSSSNETFCEQVRENMSRIMNIELTQFDERDVAELKKRPDLVRHRHGKFFT
jgi:hypothetical protein